MKTIREQDRIYMKRLKEMMPWYVQKYVNRNERTLSPSTLLGYLRDYKIFFEWILREGFSKSNSIAEVPLTVLDELRIDDIEENFLNYLAFENEIIGKQKNATNTINHKISSLRSLFYYLSNIAEDENFNPYLRRNVMAKIQISRKKIDIETKAEQISEKILFGDEIDEFREFIAEKYGLLDHNTLALTRYKQNKERDLAIISLILASGLRIGEVANLKLADVDFVDNKVRVDRKGNKEKYVPFSSIAATDLKMYLEIREKRYRVEKEQDTLFVTLQRTPVAAPMKKRSMQTMIEKYAVAFGKPHLRAHILRHTFATRFHETHKDLNMTKKQLGHESIQTTTIYTHVQDSRLQDAVEKADRREE
ncbi:tyrosine recombinase XerS [Bacillus sp. AFS098217]|uniref:tyrosine recombinase XerS n=1 Tax=Bacillus sp. AFS098217 TaxID=2033868 RepID=UPI000BEDF1F8|nr:tyrosine recombinase XerS [Bacillus sp. AFS098217]PEB54563.1 tyrosine recombinase XerS [Bacillus sp. AFS098217]